MLSLARENNAYYFTSPYSSGITEGGDWYAISGGRQDYMNFVHHCKEVTLRGFPTPKDA